MWVYVQYPYCNELYHYGVPGMKWGHRKAQPPAVTNARVRYKQAKDEYKQAKKDAVTPEQRAARRKKALVIGTAVAGTALAAYGAYKLNNYVKTKNGQIAAKRGYEHAEKMLKSEMRITSDLMSKGAFKNGTITLNANSGNAALNAARDASTDNFRTAAKNVINYKRSGGELKSLAPVGSYAHDLVGSTVTFGRKRT